MFTVAMAGGGIFSAAIILRKYMHRLPGFGNMMLLPPEEDAKRDLEVRETLGRPPVTSKVALGERERS